MAQTRRLTRAEKIEQADAIRDGVITNPRHLIGLTFGKYKLEGLAADAAKTSILEVK